MKATNKLEVKDVIKKRRIATTHPKMYGRVVAYGKCAGRSAMSNNYILEFDITHNEQFGSVVNKHKQDMSMLDETGEFARELVVSGKRETVVSGKKENVVVLKDEKGVEVKLDQDYVTYFARKYGGDIRFWSGNNERADITPVRVTRGGVWIGLIMPIYSPNGG